MFLTLMVIGLVGLVVMALPAFARHGHGAGGLHAALHAGHAVKATAALRGAGAVAKAAGSKSALVAAGQAGQALTKDGPAPAAASRLHRFIPSPRLLFSLSALYGASGNALVAAHVSFPVAAVVAILPAAAVERLAVTPLWNLLFRFQAPPSSPLEALVFSEAIAVTAFRNGRGIVSVVRDGRRVQFAARLSEGDALAPVRVGEKLRVEDVDAARERLTVTRFEGS
jgi:hypothetical protein